VREEFGRGPFSTDLDVSKAPLRPDSASGGLIAVVVGVVVCPQSPTRYAGAVEDGSGARQNRQSPSTIRVDPPNPTVPIAWVVGPLAASKGRIPGAA
jgi:hypothetical protein